MMFLSSFGSSGSLPSAGRAENAVVVPRYSQKYRRLPSSDQLKRWGFWSGVFARRRGTLPSGDQSQSRTLKLPSVCRLLIYPFVMMGLDAKGFCLIIA